MPERRPRAALIGVSGYARIHLGFLEELRRAGAIEFTAVTIVNQSEEREAAGRLRAEGVEVFSDYREMLARHHGRLELCCIPTGTPLHAAMTVAALESGANILVEKPLCPTTAEVRAIRAVEMSTGRWVAVGFQDLYAEQNRALKARLLRGEIGTVRRIAARGLWPRDAGYYARNAWAGRIAAEGRAVYDSPLGNAFAHFVTLALLLAGKKPDHAARPAGAEGLLLRVQPIENFDTAAVRLRTEEGVEILLYFSHSSRSSLEPELVVDGTLGRARWRLAEEIRLEVNGRPPDVIALPESEAVRRTMFGQVAARLHDPSAYICATRVAAEHVLACEQVQDLGIAEVRDGDRERFTTADGREWTALRGLEEAFARAWDARCLLSELPDDPQSFYHVRPSRSGGRVSAPA